MRRFYDGERITADVNRALEAALAKHGLQVWDLLGVTTVLEVIASPMKSHVAQIAGHDLGVKGVDTFIASTLARRVALLQNPNSVIVNPMMEAIAVALQRARSPLSEKRLKLVAYRLFLKDLGTTVKLAERDNSALSSAFSSACSYLSEGLVISRNDKGLWQLS